MTREPETIVIRPCVGFEELDTCVEIQEQVWGYDERDIIPRRLFVVARRIGGQIFGAFEQSTLKQNKMVGFAMALPGIRGHMPYLHSHMLAVLPSWRNAGIGRRLKLAQRDNALARGIRLMEWTFDPLEIKNAFLNIARLGVIVRSYTPNFYGPLHSTIQAGLQSDRMHAEWWMDSPHVIAALSGSAAPAAVALSLQEQVTIPAEVALWKVSEPKRHLAIELQIKNRELLQTAFANGQAVVGFTRDEQGNGAYQLGSPHAFPAIEQAENQSSNQRQDV